MTTEASAASDSASQMGLPWRDAYKDLLPVMKEDWGTANEIYLTRRLSGKSGALALAADIVSHDFTGQA